MEVPVPLVQKLQSGITFPRLYEVEEVVSVPRIYKLEAGLPAPHPRYSYLPCTHKINSSLNNKEVQTLKWKEQIYCSV